jgi:major capsid protein E
MLDVFKGDAFSMVALTDAIDKLPYRPKRIGQMGLFTEKGTSKTTVAVEERNGKLSLLSTYARGSMPQGRTSARRKIRTFSIPHIPHNDTVIADEVQGVRKFNSEDEVESVSTVINDKLQALKDDHETTWEFHRIKALHGVILDGDGTTEVLDLFEAFDVTETEIEFDFSATDTQQLKRDLLGLGRTMENALGDDTFTGIHCFCGDQFFDNLVTCDEIRVAYDRWKEGAFFRDPQRKAGQAGGTGGFEWNGVFWENYRGQIGDVKFVADDEARFFPLGTNRLFQRWNAPADFVETVNTIGKALYAKQEVMKFDKGVEIHTQSNPLFLVTRPAVLIKGTDITPVES